MNGGNARHRPADNIVSNKAAKCMCFPHLQALSSLSLLLPMDSDSLASDFADLSIEEEYLNLVDNFIRQRRQDLLGPHGQTPVSAVQEILRSRGSTALLANSDGEAASSTTSSHQLTDRSAFNRQDLQPGNSDANSRFQSLHQPIAMIRIEERDEPTPSDAVSIESQVGIDDEHRRDSNNGEAELGVHEEQKPISEARHEADSSKGSIPPSAGVKESDPSRDHSEQSLPAVAPSVADSCTDDKAGEGSLSQKDLPRIQDTLRPGEQPAILGSEENSTTTLQVPEEAAHSSNHVTAGASKEDAGEGKEPTGSQKEGVKSETTAPRTDSLTTAAAASLKGPPLPAVAVAASHEVRFVDAGHCTVCFLLPSEAWSSVARIFALESKSCFRSPRLIQEGIFTSIMSLLFPEFSGCS